MLNLEIDWFNRNSSMILHLDQRSSLKLMDRKIEILLTYVMNSIYGSKRFLKIGLKLYNWTIQPTQLLKIKLLHYQIIQDLQSTHLFWFLMRVHKTYKDYYKC